MPFTPPPLQNDLLLRVLHREPVPRTPVWMMRQAGRTDPEYRRLREEDGRPLEELFADVEKSIEVSLLPRRFGVDAIIMFQDILTPLTPVGAPFRFRPGPQLAQPIRTLGQVQALRPLSSDRDLNHVGEVLQGIHQRLEGALPVLGFAGAPVTLAFFLIAGGSPNRDPQAVLDFFEKEPEVTRALLEYLTDLTIDYLAYQLDSGAQAVQLFESFADVLPRELYTTLALPTHQRIFEALSGKGPTLLFAKECPHLDLMQASGAQALSIGKCLDLADVKQAAPGLIVQGNVDNLILADGTPEQVRSAVRECLKKGEQRQHILNLSHGLLERSPFENVLTFVETAQEG
jgi:uroporphyrinogen decarboxylase